MSDSQEYPWNMYLIKNMEDIVVCSRFKVLNSDNSSCFPAVEHVQVTFVETHRPPLKFISFQNNKHWYLIHTWSDKALNRSFVNRTLSSLHEWSCCHVISCYIMLSWYLKCPFIFCIFSYSCFYLLTYSPEMEFKEFERWFKFKPRLKYGWFHLKLYQMFQDLSRRLI